MPNAEGKGFVDYVLWGDDGKPLAARRGEADEEGPAGRAAAGEALRRLSGDSSSASGRSSSTRTATTTGSGTTRRYPPRAVQGFYKKDELELLIQRRDTRKTLASGDHQRRRSSNATTRRAPSGASRESFERDHQRKALLVMATGAGKTRTVIALVRPARCAATG